MNKSLWMLLLLWVLLTALNEMNRPQDPIGKTSGKELTVKDKPGHHPAQVYNLNNSLSMRTPK